MKKKTSSSSFKTSLTKLTGSGFTGGKVERLVEVGQVVAGHQFRKGA